MSSSGVKYDVLEAYLLVEAAMKREMSEASLRSTWRVWNCRTGCILLAEPI
jgi:hypothetical protein